MCHVITDIITSQHSSLLNEQLLVITKCDRVVLQSATALFITKCDKCYYTVRQVWQSATLLQSVTVQFGDLFICLSFYSKAIRRVHLFGLSFGWAEATFFLLNAAAFRLGGYLVVKGELSMDNVLKWVDQSRH